jgi:hypothetical protein
MLLRFYYCSSQQAVSAIFLRKLSYNKTYPFDKCSFKNQLKFLAATHRREHNFSSLQNIKLNLYFMYCAWKGQKRQREWQTKINNWLVKYIVRKIAKILLFICILCFLVNYVKEFDQIGSAREWCHWIGLVRTFLTISFFLFELVFLNGDQNYMALHARIFLITNSFGGPQAVGDSYTDFVFRVRLPDKKIHQTRYPISHLIS